MAKIKCWTDLADSMEEYVGRQKEKLAELEAKRKSEKADSGKEGEEGQAKVQHKKKNRRRRQADTSVSVYMYCSATFSYKCYDFCHVSQGDRSKRECSNSEPVSVPQLAAKVHYIY